MDFTSVMAVFSRLNGGSLTAMRLSHPALSFPIFKVQTSKAVPFIQQLRVHVGLAFNTFAFPDPRYIPVGGNVTLFADTMATSREQEEELLCLLKESKRKRQKEKIWMSCINVGWSPHTSSLQNKHPFCNLEHIRMTADDDIHVTQINVACTHSYSE